MNEHKEDKVPMMLEKLIDKLNWLEEKWHQKADVRAVEDLECRAKQLEDSAKKRVSNASRVQQLEENVMRQVNDIKVKISQNCEKLSQYELHQAAVEGEEVMSSDEQRETEKRKKSMVLYRVPEIHSDDTNERKAGDMLFLHELCIGCYCW